MNKTTASGEGEAMQANVIRVAGHIVNLPNDRSVFLSRQDGSCCIQFTNGDRRMRLRLSPEALDALVKLATQPDECEQFWEVAVPLHEVKTQWEQSQPNDTL